MNRRTALILVLTLFNLSYAQIKKTVYHIGIEGDIDLGLAPYVARVIEEANEKNADAIIIELNTFGGRVDAATQIRDAIITSRILTVAFVNKRAISAGALITISAKKIAMSLGSTMGASTVVGQTGEKAPEKYQSYMRSEMRSTAEKNNRRPDIAEAMVDEKIVIKDFPQLDDSTKLLTITTEEALKVGYCDFIVNDINELLEKLELENANIVRTETNWAEDIVRFLSNPIISSLLIMLGILGLFTEIKTPGWGVPGTVGLIALALFFGTNYILELANIWEILVFLLGLALLLIEIFYIPGFGFLGILGIILMIGSIFFGLIGELPIITGDDVSLALIQLAFSIFSSILVLAILWKFLPRTTMWNRLILSISEEQTKGFISNPELDFLIGKKGKAITPLRPAGIALIDGNRYDVIAEGEFITKNSEIEVIGVVGSKVTVKKVGNQEF